MFTPTKTRSLAPSLSVRTMAARLSCLARATRKNGCASICTSDMDGEVRQRGLQRRESIAVRAASLMGRREMMLRRSVSGRRLRRSRLTMSSSAAVRRRGRSTASSVAWTASGLGLGSSVEVRPSSLRI
jgi:hypothetical protein